MVIICKYIDEAAIIKDYLELRGISVTQLERHSYGACHHLLIPGKLSPNFITKLEQQFRSYTLEYQHE